MIVVCQNKFDIVQLKLYSCNQSAYPVNTKIGVYPVATSTRPKRSMVGIELVRLLAYEGDRIFTTVRARELAPRIGLKDAYVAESLHHLRNNNWIVPLRRGLYALSPTVPGVAAAHEFEIAMALVDPAAISHWSALHHHGLTEQVPRHVFVLTTKGTWIPRSKENRQRRHSGSYAIGDTTYRFVQVKRDRFFGSEEVWVGDARVSITDLERTLLDGLSMPQHCGDFAEVLHAFQLAKDRLDTGRAAGYAKRLGVTTAKRLGWVLEDLGASSPELDRLAALPIKGYRKLDPTAPRRGPCNNRWMMQENLPGLIAG